MQSAIARGFSIAHRVPFGWQSDWVRQDRTPQSRRQRRVSAPAGFSYGMPCRTLAPALLAHCNAAARAYVRRKCRLVEGVLRQQLGDGGIQRVREPGQYRDRGVPDAPLNPRHVCPVNPGCTRKVFLRHAQPLPRKA